MDLGGGVTIDTTGLFDTLQGYVDQGAATVDNYLQSAEGVSEPYPNQGYVNGATPTFFDTTNNGLFAGNSSILIFGLVALGLYLLLLK